jgi:DNA-binding NarL/FixJ family response regulator
MIEDYVPPPTRLTPITIEDFLTRPFPPREMILGPWLPTKGLAMIYAPRGLGKTHFAWGLAYAVATGGPFLGGKAPSPRNVLLVDGEMAASTLRDRMAAIIETGGGVRPAEGMIRVISADQEPEGIPDLSTIEGQAALDEVLHDAELIILDNLSTLCRSGKENEAESWSAVQAWALAKRREGRTVVFIHHAGKGGAQRGTSRREDVLDSVVSLKRPQDYHPTEGARFEVHFEKARGFAGVDAEPFEAMLTPAGWTMKKLATVREAQVMELHEQGLTQRQIAKALHVSAATVNRSLKKAPRADGATVEAANEES